jgi:hypothetical protein
MPNLILRAKAISLSPHQNSSSTLTLVLRPEMTTLRFRIPFRIQLPIQRAITSGGA